MSGDWGNFSHQRVRRSMAACCVALALAARAAAADEMIYADGLNTGWENWSWATVNLSATAFVHQGTRATAVTLDQGWSGLYFHTAGSSPADRLRFYINGGSAAGQDFWVRAITQGDTWEDAVSISSYVAVAAGTWKLADIALADLNADGKILEGISLQKSSGDSTPLPTFYLDDMLLVRLNLPTPTPLSQRASLSVDVLADVHPISPYIYGMAFMSDQMLADLHPGLHRFGGNHTTRHNWELNTTNRANDWFFLNTLESSGPPGAWTDDFIARSDAAGVPVLMTVPTIDWVAKDGSSSSSTVASSCGLSAPSNPTETSIRAFPAKGVPFADPPNTTDGAVYTDEWIHHMVRVFGPDQPRFLAMDNESDIWSSTHIDVHPQCGTYDDVFDHFTRWAVAAKAASPAAEVTGPVSTGWWFFWNSMAGGADKTAHGGMDFLPWFLQSMKTFDDQRGARTLDVFDIHYYQEPGLLSNNNTDAATSAMRLRSTRALWDPTYTDESWIGTNPPEWTSSQPNARQVQLIPRMKRLIDTYYPGTKLGITEYSWGALSHISGGLALADVLGIFGREDVYAAAQWGTPPVGSPGYSAFKIYRNYDGAGSQFGDRSARAVSDRPDILSVYASTDSSSGALKIIVVNKSPNAALTADIALAHFAPGATIAVYGFDAAQPAIQRYADLAGNTAVFGYTFAPYSVTLFAIPGQPAAGSPSPTPTASPLPPTPSRTRSRTATITVSPTRVPPTATVSPRPTSSATPVPTRTPSPRATATPSRRATSTRTPTRTPTRMATRTRTPSRRPTATRTPTRTPTRPRTATRTPTRRPTVTATRMPSRRPTRTPTHLPTRTPT